MKNIKFFFVMGTVSFLIACSGNKANPVSDSAKTLAVDTASKTVTPQVVIDPQENLNLVVKDIINTMKVKGDLSKLNKYVFPGVGLYQNYPLPDGGSEFQHMEQLDQIIGDEANGPGPDSYLDFQTKVSKIDTSKVNVNYDFPKLDECSVTKKGTFDVPVPKPFDFLSGNYTATVSANGGTVDKDEVAKIKKMEGMVTDAVIVNLFDDSHGSSAVVMYFGKVNNKWYFFVLDLVNLCDNE